MKCVYSSFGMAVNVMRQVPVLRIVENHKYKPSSMQVWHMGMTLHMKLKKQ